MRKVGGRFGLRSSAAWLAGFALLSAGAAQAQSAAPVAAPTAAADKTAAAVSVQVEQINVTASRTGSQNIQDVPMSVTALQPATLNTLGLNNMEQIARLVPSLSMIDEGPGISSVTIRGLAVRGIDTSETEDRPLVETYLDDTPLSVKSANPDLKVIDLEDVEVLRGPQGTLYGAESMAGTIRLVTQKPNTNEFFGYIEGSASDTGGYGGFNDTGRVMINIPLITDQLAIRVSAYHDDYSGYIKDIATGILAVNTSKTTNPETTDQERIAIRWKPAEDLTVDFSVLGDVLHGGLNFALSGLPAYETNVPTTTASDQNLTLYAMNTRYDFDHVSINSATSFTNFRTKYVEDESETDHYYNFYYNGPLEPATFVARNSITDLVEELRATSRDTGPLKLTGGVYLERGTRDTTEENPTEGLDAFYGQSIGIPNYNSQINDLAFEPNDSYDGRIRSINNQVAVFGEGTYTLWDRLDLTAGLRFFDWTEKYKIYAVGLEGNITSASATDPIGVPTAQNAKAAATGTTPRFAAMYHFTQDLNVWAEVAKGFRYGGANQPIPISYCGADLAQLGLSKGPPAFGPDKLWSYSLGEKSQFFNHRLTFDVTAFWINWTNTQTTNYLECSYYYTSNVGNVVSRGVELESTMVLAPGLKLLLNGAYNDAYASTAITNLDAPAGTRAPFAPAYMASVTGTYDRKLYDHDLQFSFNYSYKGCFTNEFDQAQGAFRVVPASNALNAAVTYYLKRFEVSVFADNLTNEATIYDIAAQPYGVFQPGDNEALARPRTVGVRLRASF